MRTNYCADTNESLVGKKVELVGWAGSYRDHGGVIFIDLRDRTGIVQLVCDPEHNKQAHELASTIRDEFVLKVKGSVRLRGEGLVNNKIPTGKIEVIVDELIIENKSDALPFVINDENVGEEIRLKYRYLDLRRPKMFDIFKTRSKVTTAVRSFLDTEGFLEVETPMLTKATPEGARDYIVPSRVHQGDFFALPQSPQLFKQLLMVGGFDKYFQIAKCFRDEDLRANRQPEFTQIDIEMSFCEQEDIIKLSENMMVEIFKAAGKTIKPPFNRITFDYSMENYGSDKPDCRFDLKLQDILGYFKDSSNEIFSSMSSDTKKNRIKALIIPGGDEKFSRKSIKELESFVTKFGAKGLAYFQMKEEGIKGPLLKFMSESSVESMVKDLGLKTGDIMFIGAGSKKTVLDYMGRLRLKVASDLGLIDENKFEFVWVVDFPMFEIEEGKFKATHHPFTMPKNIDAPLDEISSIAYDLALNGEELGGGSIRIHKTELQERVFKLLKISDEEANEKFGFLLDALKLGTPPHGGIAFGLDRIIMFLCKTSSIRDVIAFPKTQRAQCLMTQAPASVPTESLAELAIKVNIPNKN
ncbi:MAG: Aspartyl-tRNA synthetase (EC @ Aspartyl-tRNA(Asn) synthetase (EC [uncultured Campylobacterales bacterium]|uniref:Aspartate--tRNA(Asp/Asn) ligase n=1 Tax=uncultured Campylobacterales bacterium TaxID=352960 RepID=A0A6S6SLM9_9BACT|nr:MAG: Aspartyl-tRNA synthetase (EC @ Aspartyl-tRNA(Asn) synthetase (EC [uncultured Campylobacterales bacterium]